MSNKLDELQAALDDIPELNDDIAVVVKRRIDAPVINVLESESAWGSADRLAVLFALQREFMEMLRGRGKLADFPVDLTSKDGQKLINTTVWDSVRELAEAAQHLKNKVHRVTDDRQFDRAAYLEELADAHAFFLEVLIMSDVSHQEFYEAFVMKNSKVKRRLLEGY